MINKVFQSMTWILVCCRQEQAVEELFQEYCRAQRCDKTCDDAKFGCKLFQGVCW